MTRGLDQIPNGVPNCRQNLALLRNIFVFACTVQFYISQNHVAPLMDLSLGWVDPENPRNVILIFFEEFFVFIGHEVVQ